jgi:[ribosomal protein S5]-alanine N-acetyltransferase
MYILETARLVLREFTTEDAQSAYLLNLNPEVIKYTGDAPFENVEAAKKFLSQYNHYQKYGFGRWAVLDKSNQTFLGWCGLKYTPELNEFDIGYRFLQQHWGKGYATESAQACVKFGFNSLGMQEIVGRALQENKASIRVLQKIGLQFWKEQSTDQGVEVIYKITKSN